MIYHEILKLLCVEYKVCSIEYFMDEMQEYEVNCLIDWIPYMDINSWEQARLTIYTIAQTQSTKKLDMKELMKFPWDDGYKEKKPLDMDEMEEMARKSSQYVDQDIERLRQKAELISKQYGNINNKT